MPARYEDEEGRRVLCFGDSNTWGYEPVTGKRYAANLRWPGVLAKELGPGYRILEEGLKSRTSVFEDPLGPYRSGLGALPMLLDTHAPLDLVIILLGANDFMARFAAPACDIAEGLGRLARTVLASPMGPGGGAPHVLLVAPPPLTRLGHYAETFAGGAEKSRLLPERLRDVAAQVGAAFFEAGTVTQCSDRDGLHYEPEEHAKLGRALAQQARRLLEG